MWIMATTLDSTDLDSRIFSVKRDSNVKALEWEGAFIFQEQEGLWGECILNKELGGIFLGHNKELRLILNTVKITNGV